MITREALREETAKAKLYYARQEGLEQGREQEKARVALNLLKTGSLSVEQISEITELSLEALEQIKIGKIKPF